MQWHIDVACCFSCCIGNQAAIRVICLSMSPCLPRFVRAVIEGCQQMPKGPWHRVHAVKLHVKWMQPEIAYNWISQDPSSSIKPQKDHCMLLRTGKTRHRCRQRLRPVIPPMSVSKRPYRYQVWQSVQNRNLAPANGRMNLLGRLSSFSIPFSSRIALNPRLVLNFSAFASLFAVQLNWKKNLVYLHIELNIVSCFSRGSSEYFTRNDMLVCVRCLFAVGFCDRRYPLVKTW